MVKVKEVGKVEVMAVEVETYALDYYGEFYGS